MPTYTTLLIPSSLPAHTLTPLAHKLRDFKLYALLSDPEAFSQDHATEFLLPLSAWEARVSKPEFRIVVCVVEDGEQHAEEREDQIVERLLQSDWAGTFTLVGPVPLSSWLVPSSAQPPPRPDTEETRWHLTSLFVLPEHRGGGLASELTLAAVRAGSSASLSIAVGEEGDHGARSAEFKTRFRLIVHPKNIEVVWLYEKLGFVKGGMYTQREAMVAMGDAAGVPVGAVGEKWDTRLAIGMECLV